MIISGQIVLIITFGLSLALATDTVTSSDARSEFNLAWRYRYQCANNDGACVRVKTDADDRTPSFYETHEICRLVCGKHGPIWPRPTGTTVIRNKLTYVDPREIKYEIGTHSTEVSEYLETIKSIFLANVMLEAANYSVLEMTSNKFIVHLIIKSENMTLSWDTDESYKLNTTVAGNWISTVITASTVYGIRHGLETLSQLITILPNRDDADKTSFLIAGDVALADRPVFPHRGFMLDTARHFIPVLSILKMLDGMAASKLNIFHWHATDSQSFPLEITRVPQMTKFGSYSPKEVYSRRDIDHIYKYARDRGIRVLLEMDAPSHAGSGWQWGPAAGLGNLVLCMDSQPWRTYCYTPPCGHLNPANPNLYHVIKQIFQEFVEIMPKGESFHMGGDEVFLSCWNSSSEITDLLAKEGHGRKLEDFLQLWAEYQATTQRIWDEESGVSLECSRSCENRVPSPIILWSSHLTNPETIEKYLQKERYIIQTWLPNTSDIPTELLNKGYRLIITTKNAWYLDHGFWGTTSYYSWRDVYSNRIIRAPGVLGGETCMWTEFVDENSLEARVWPRAAAAAERLWSDLDVDPKRVEFRFYRHRDRLVTRGIDAEAVTPRWCGLNDGACS